MTSSSPGTIRSGFNSLDASKPTGKTPESQQFFGSARTVARTRKVSSGIDDRASPAGVDA